MIPQNVDIQYFAESGTWVRPPRALRADCLIQAAGAGASSDGHPGEAGELQVKSLYPPLPETITVEIGRGGRGIGGNGADGYALIVTHLGTEDSEGG